MSQTCSVDAVTTSSKTFSSSISLRHQEDDASTLWKYTREEEQDVSRTLLWQDF